MWACTVFLWGNITSVGLYCVLVSCNGEMTIHRLSTQWEIAIQITCHFALSDHLLENNVISLWDGLKRYLCENTIVAFGSRISSEWQIVCIISVKIYQRSNSTTYSEELFHKTLFKDFFQGHYKLRFTERYNINKQI